MLEPHYTDDAVTLYHGDCLDVIRQLGDATVDAVITDPPYGLEFMGRAWDSFAPEDPILRSGFDDAATGAGFATGMNGTVAPNYGKRRSTWTCSACQRRDAFRNPHTCQGENVEWLHTWVDAKPLGALAFGAWCETWAAECLRVLKPGGHLVAFGGSRTWHRLACAVEDVGFEVRDSIAWLYATGFPKSLDVSKAIDKRRDDTGDAERRDLILTVTAWIRAARNTAGLSNGQIDAAFGLNGMAGHWTSSASQPAIPTAEFWPRLVELLGQGEPPADVRDAVDTWLTIKGQPAPTWSLREVTGQHVNAAPAQTWNANYGNAANPIPRERRDKPATEEAARWQGWGTALKPAFEPIVVGRKPLASTVAGNVLEHGTGALNIDANRLPMTAEDRERFAAGAAAWERMSEERGETLASGETRKSMSVYGDYGNVVNPNAHDAGRWPPNVLLDDETARQVDNQTAGTGSKFFPVFHYEAKAPTIERPRDGEISHPTVKPLDLMRWLVRLVTPPGGTVLEPFAGSGTTAEACVVEGFACIAIEREADYLPLIVNRLTKPIPLDLFGGTTE